MRRSRDNDEDRDGLKALDMQQLITRLVVELEEERTYEQTKSAIRDAHLKTLRELADRSLVYVLQNFHKVSTLDRGIISAIGPIVNFCGENGLNPGREYMSILTCGGHAYFFRSDDREPVTLTWMKTPVSTLQEAREYASMRQADFEWRAVQFKMIEETGWTPSVEEADERIRPAMRAMQQYPTLLRMLTLELTYWVERFQWRPESAFKKIEQAPNKRSRTDE